jgi:lipase maturation factor 1
MESYSSQHSILCRRLSELRYAQAMSVPKPASLPLKPLLHPGPFTLTESLFLRMLGLIYLSAFASLWPQIIGLLGSSGIEPATRLLASLHSEGASLFRDAPTLFWFGISDPALVGFCAVGCLASLALFLGFYPRISAAVCWALYLSLTTIGQPFMGFQWDALLLEAGFLALFAGTPWLVWAYRFLLFRLMFESGIVKLLSGDPNWKNFHALRFHFLTQPLPNPLAYYAYRLPAWMLDSMTFASLAIELVVPFFLFAPRRLRHIVTVLLASLQVFILLTGNYAFFNFLTLALCLWGFDDEAFAPAGALIRRTLKPISWRPLQRGLGAVLALLILIGLIQVLAMLAPDTGRPLARHFAFLAPWQIVNTYGLFAVMTTTRPEIVIEGSEDAEHWREYVFRYKPGPTHRGLPSVAPYQPRLDWQMWFAALGDYQQNIWVGGLMYRLLTGSSAVTKLLDTPPFLKPPHYMRALLYDYRFTTPSERSRTGAVWERTLRGTWFGPVSLTGQ